MNNEINFSHWLRWVDKLYDHISYSTRNLCGACNFKQLWNITNIINIVFIYSVTGNILLFKYRYCLSYLFDITSNLRVVTFFVVDCLFFFFLNCWVGLLIFYSSTIVQELIFYLFLGRPRLCFPNGWYLIANFDSPLSSILSTFLSNSSGMSKFLILCFVLISHLHITIYKQFLGFLMMYLRTTFKMHISAS
jgi:hypothetical protein